MDLMFFWAVVFVVWAIIHSANSASKLKQRTAIGRGPIVDLRALPDSQRHTANTMAVEYELTKDAAFAIVERFFQDQLPSGGNRISYVIPFPNNSIPLSWQIEEANSHQGTVRAFMAWTEELRRIEPEDPVVWRQRSLLVTVFLTPGKTDRLAFTDVSYQWSYSFEGDSDVAGAVTSQTIAGIDNRLCTEGGLLATAPARRTKQMKPPRPISRPRYRSNVVRGALGTDTLPDSAIESDSEKTVPRWPTLQEFNEAIQNPTSCFSDPELKNGRPVLNKLGLPRVDSGAFGSVYRIRCEGRDYAVKCFSQEVRDQADRYRRISEYIVNDDLESTVAFEYLADGIRIGRNWYPMLKMEWVDGLSLSQYIERNLHDRLALEDLAGQFREMFSCLAVAGIAHGDLQHGNIIVLSNGRLRLVDYDGMFVPQLNGAMSNELGHRNYQHPQRAPRHFGPYLDNFAARIIETSVVALSEDPDLWQRLNGGDDCLLFRASDFKNPQAPVWNLLGQHRSESINNRARFIQSLLQVPVEMIPSPVASGSGASSRGS